jgi:HAD superfamily hydrolase (TIGR01450 family)
MTSSMSTAGQDAPSFGDARLWIIDLDGVIWLTGEAIGDIAGAISRLDAHGIEVAFATNNSAPTTSDLLARLDRIGVPATADQLVTSAGAAASLFQPGQSVAVLAETGVHEALDARGVHRTEGTQGTVDAAVVGWTHAFDFATLAAIATAARTSGRLIGTNEDPTHPTPDGLMPGTGALLAAVATASGVTPEVAGKPHHAMAALMQERFGFASGDPSVVMIGDQPRTDGRLAASLGIAFGLVDSGVTPATTHSFDVPVAHRAADFVSLVTESLATATTR